MTYTPPYPGGWQDLPDTSTPIDAASLNAIDIGITGAYADAAAAQGTADQAIIDAAAVASSGFRLWDIVYFSSSGSFTKATYPWLRAVRVKVQAGGGGGGGAAAITTSPRSAVSGGGGGGEYREAFITDIAGLDASVTVTIGAGGAAGAAGANNGTTGGTSSFGTAVSCVGGGGGDGNSQSSLTAACEASGGVGGSGGSGGEFVCNGNGGDGGVQYAGQSVLLAKGGSSFLGRTTTGGRVITRSSGAAGSNGSGGAGAATTSVVSGTQAAIAGAAGGAGVIILELYA